MARGPRGEKRPADAIGRAVMVAKIATGEMTESLSPARVERARMGGQARMAALSDGQRSEIARRAAGVRWSLKEANMHDECAKLAKSYEAKRASGLLDVKFFLHDTDKVLKEDVCAEVNRLDAAIADGAYVPLVFDDRRRKD